MSDVSEMNLEERPYANEHAARIHEPSKYVRFRRRNDAGGPGIDFIFGILPDNGGTELQSVRFDKSRYTAAEAKKWMSDHDHKVIQFEEASERSEDLEERAVVKIEIEVDTSDAPDLPDAPEDSIDATVDDAATADGDNAMIDELLGQLLDAVNRKEAAKVLHRANDMQARSIDEKTRTVQIAVSSELPYERSFGNEILDHSEKSIDLNFLRSGRAPLLLDHDPEKQIGVIESVSLDGDRVLRSKVRFGRSALAQEVFQDVVDGIRGNISVGYRVNKMERDSKVKDAYRVISWSPVEVSVVSIPADPSVGVGRSAAAPEIEPTVIEPSVRKDVNMSEELNMDAVRAEFARNVADILALGAKHNSRDLAEKAIREGKSIDQFRGELLEVIGDKPLDNKEIGLTNKERKRFSLVRAIHALSNPTDRAAQEAARFEFEASAAAARSYGVTAQGLMVPSEVLANWKRDLNTTDDNELVATDLRSGDFIDVLRNASSVMQAGARMLTGLSGNVAIPKKTAASAAAWISTEGGDSTESEPTFGQVLMSPKTLGAFTDLTRQMILQSSLDIEALVREDLTMALALKIDDGALEGDGLSGAPTGIKATSGVNKPTSFAAAVPTYAEIVALETAVAEDNALMGNLAYITDAGTFGGLKTKTKDAGSGQFVVEPGNTLNGYRSIVSNQVTSGDVYFGNFSDLLIGMWGGLDITVDPYTASKSGTVRIVALQSVDVAVRNAVSFAYNNDGV